MIACMNDQKIIDQILTGSQKAHKHYSFDESHNRNMPADIWFQHSTEGLILFVVFYSQACRWSQCLGCNLPSLMSTHHISFESLMKQIDHLFELEVVTKERLNIQKVIASNNGSILDQETFSSTALMYFLAKLNIHLPNLNVLSIETRAEFVEFAELEFMARALAESSSGTILELAIGFEAFDNRIRNEIFNKGLPLETFERFVRKAAPFGYHVKAYFMLKPVPGITNKEAIEDIRRAIEYLSDLAESHDVAINMHLNPTYVATGTVLEDEFSKGNYSPPKLSDVTRAAMYSKDKPISVYIGLSDEHLAVEGGSFIRAGDEEMVAQLELFNRTQDYRILQHILTGAPIKRKNQS